VHRVAQRSGPQQAGHRRAARQALQGAGQFHQRALARARRARRSVRWRSIRRMRFIGGDFGLGLLDARGKGGGFLRGLVGGGAGAGGGGLQLSARRRALSASARASARSRRVCAGSSLAGLHQGQGQQQRAHQPAR
jgi:hypothetical protein